MARRVSTFFILSSMKYCRCCVIKTPKKKQISDTKNGMSIINLIIKRDYIIDLPSRRFHDPLSLTSDVKVSDKSSGM